MVGHETSFEIELTPEHRKILSADGSKIVVTMRPALAATPPFEVGISERCEVPGARAGVAVITSIGGPSALTLDEAPEVTPGHRAAAYLAWFVRTGDPRAAEYAEEILDTPSYASVDVSHLRLRSRNDAEPFDGELGAGLALSAVLGPEDNAKIMALLLEVTGIQHAPARGPEEAGITHRTERATMGGLALADECPNCSGRGYHEHEHNERITCSICLGTGDKVPAPCRRCSECRGENHHWLEECTPPATDMSEDTGWAGYICKHCDAKVEMCDACSGPDEPGHACEDEEGGDLEDRIDRAVKAGDREDTHRVSKVPRSGMEVESTPCEPSCTSPSDATTSTAAQPPPSVSPPSSIGPSTPGSSQDASPSHGTQRRVAHETRPSTTASSSSRPTSADDAAPPVAHEEPNASKSSPRWRVGRTVGRTIYFDDMLQGMLDSRVLADKVVALLNADMPPKNIEEA